MIRVVGKQVRSQKNGNGIVVNVEEIKNKLDYYVTISFDDNNKQFLLSTAIIKGSFYFIDRDVQSFVENFILEKFKHREQNIKTEKPINPPIEQLIRNQLYGTNAKKIYIRFCNKYGWDILKAHCFTFETKLYAEKAAGDYSVWMIAHSNLTGTTGGHWKNEILEYTIKEEHEDSFSYSCLGDIRITFYKSKNADMQYVFGGIYKQFDTYIKDENHMVVVYKRISDRYPV